MRSVPENTSACQWDIPHYHDYTTRNCCITSIYPMYDKTIIGWGFCDIQNNQGRGKGYQPKPKAEADNPYRELDYSGYCKKTNANNYCFMKH